MTEQPPVRDEKREEKDEKDVSKREEKTMEEKWRRDPLGSIVWAAILIWAGLVFLADNLGMLRGLQNIAFPGTGVILQSGAWSLVLLGAGLILVIEIFIRLTVPTYRAPVGGTIILAAILISLGLGNLISWNLFWPLILIALGVIFVLRSFTRRL